MAEPIEAAPTRRGLYGRSKGKALRPHQAQLVAGGNGDDDLRGMGVLAHVGQGLAEHCQYLLDQGGADRRVHRTTEGHLREEPQHGT